MVLSQVFVEVRFRSDLTDKASRVKPEFTFNQL
jgi:hypothetical protein